MLSHEKKNLDTFEKWLTFNLLLIFIMIVVGGLTRLTNSGLSITEWELFRGILPPLNKKSWDDYFLLYKMIPQYKLINPMMTLDEFKIIFYWEYAHRFLGRLIGITFFVPLAYFHFTKRFNFNDLLPCYLISCLILFQGIIGWYMVKSGLVNNTTVSHYRLSLHLSIAIIIISMIFWQLLELKNEKKLNFFDLSKKNFYYFILLVLIFLQIIIGAFVSGLDAGQVYQTWPKMNNEFFPDDTKINKFSDFINFENHSLVQFYHRNIAYLITLYSLIICYFTFKTKNKKMYRPIILFLLVLIVQIFLGIFTLLSDLHLVLASFHQISSVILILSTINLYSYSIK